MEATRKKSSRFNKGRNIIFLLLITTIPSLQETNYCKESSGKCAKCIKDLTDSSILRCSKCWNSVITKEGKCEGSSTGITNCLATGQTVYGISFFPPATGDFTPICAQCEKGYHPDLFKAECYSTPEIENCEMEFKASTGGVTVAACYGCKNGYALEMKTATESDFSTTKCTPGKEIPGCYLVSYNNFCIQCEDGKGYKGPEICEERTGIEGEKCFQGFWFEGANGGCAGFGCNAKNGYFSVGIAQYGPNDVCEKVEGGDFGGESEGFKGIFLLGGLYLSFFLLGNK